MPKIAPYVKNPSPVQNLFFLDFLSFLTFSTTKSKQLEASQVMRFKRSLAMPPISPDAAQKETVIIIDAPNEVVAGNNEPLETQPLEPTTVNEPTTAGDNQQTAAADTEPTAARDNEPKTVEDMNDEPVADTTNEADGIVEEKAEDAEDEAGDDHGVVKKQRIE